MAKHRSFTLHDRYYTDVEVIWANQTTSSRHDTDRSSLGSPKPLRVKYTSTAQEKQPFRMGFQLQEVGSDFGLGLHADLPLPGKFPVLRLSGAWHWLEIAPENRTQTASFDVVRLGLASR